MRTFMLDASLAIVFGASLYIAGKLGKDSFDRYVDARAAKMVPVSRTALVEKTWQEQVEEEREKLIEAIIAAWRAEKVA